jgi:ATP phosphoribosyltransferase
VEDLGYGRVDLVVAVPEGWLDVEDVDDLASLSRERGEEGRALRIATKFIALTGAFFEQKRVRPVRFVPSHGSTEAAPRRGDADLIADLSETGTTLVENGLRPLRGGLVLRSAACLLASAKGFKEAPERLGLVRPVVEAIEARLHAKGFLRCEVVAPRKLTERLVAEIREHVAHDRDRGVAVLAVAATDRDVLSFLVERGDLERTRRRLQGLGVTHLELSEVGRFYAQESSAMARLEAVVKHR